MSKSRLLAVFACTALLAASLVSPALGGPSLGSVAKKATKALGVAKKANRKAKSAKTAADNAGTVAGTANGKATDAYNLAATANTNATNALARGQITLVDSAPVFYGPSDVVQVAIAFCPGGQRVVSGGGINVADEQLAASLATDDRSGWGVIGVDLFDDGGEYIQAQALCAPSGQAVAANRRAARAQIAKVASRIERARAAKRCFHCKRNGH